FPKEEFVRIIEQGHKVYGKLLRIENGYRVYGIYDTPDHRNLLSTEYHNPLGQVIAKKKNNQIIITREFLPGTNIAKLTEIIDFDSTDTKGNRKVTTRALRCKEKALFLVGDSFTPVVDNESNLIIDVSTENSNLEEYVDSKGRPVRVIQLKGTDFEIVTKNTTFSLFGEDYVAVKSEISYTKTGRKVFLEYKSKTVDKDITYTARDEDGNIWEEAYSIKGKPKGNQIVLIRDNTLVRGELKQKANELMGKIYETQDALKKAKENIDNSLLKSRNLLMLLANSEEAKRAGINLTPVDIEEIDMLVKYFLGKIQLPEIGLRKLLHSKFAPFVGSEYYKALLEEITSISDFDKKFTIVYDLYKLFLNGSASELGFDHALIVARKSLEKEVTKANLNIFRSRLRMTHPDTFHWIYYDFVNDRVIQIEYGRDSFARLRREGNRIFFEKGELKESSKRETKGNEITDMKYDVKYVVVYIDELKLNDDLVSYDNRKGKPMPGTNYRPELRLKQGQRLEYYQHNKDDELTLKLMDEEDIKDMITLYYTKDNYNEIYNRVPPFVFNKKILNYKLIVYHYYREGTNIERGYEKIIEGEGLEAIGIPKDTYGRRRQAIEIGNLRMMNNAQYLNSMGRMIMNVRLTFEPWRNTEYARQELDNPFGWSLLAIFKKLTEQGFNGREVLINSYIKYTKQMDCDGQDARFEPDEQRPERYVGREKIRYKAGDVIPYSPHMRLPKSFEIEEGDPAIVIKKIEEEEMRKLAELSEEEKKNGPNRITDDVKKRRGFIPLTQERALEQRTASIDPNTRLTISYKNSSVPGLGIQSFTFDTALEIMLNVAQGARDRVFELIGILKKTEKRDGFFFSSYDITKFQRGLNNEIVSVGGKEFKNVVGPQVHIGIAIAKAIEKFGDAGNQNIEFLVKEIAEPVYNLMAEHEVTKSDGRPLEARIVPLGPGSNTAGIEHNLGTYLLFKYLGEKLDGELGLKYKEASKRIANFLKTPVERGGAYFSEEGRFVRGIRDI
ncbi:MAG: hypothetical protein AAB267_03350, partial [Candidatus Desantisbacteria bacterium]